MPVAIRTELDRQELAALRRALSERVLTRTARKAGSTGLRDANAEARKRIRRRKHLKSKLIRRAMHLSRPRGAVRLDNLEWRIDLTGKPVPLSAYPVRQTRRGVTAKINRGQLSRIPSAFIATMRTGHRGVFVRRGKKRLPIRELLGSRPVDALLHAGEAEGVVRRGQDSFVRAFARLLPLELEKEGARGG